MTYSGAICMRRWQHRFYRRSWCSPCGDSSLSQGFFSRPQAQEKQNGPVYLNYMCTQRTSTRGHVPFASRLRGQTNTMLHLMCHIHDDPNRVAFGVRGTGRGQSLLVSLNKRYRQKQLTAVTPTKSALLPASAECTPRRTVTSGQARKIKIEETQTIERTHRAPSKL